MRNYLIDEPPILLSPTLATIIGINEAMFVQQLHYWLSNPKVEGEIIDGEKWVYNTYENWRADNFPFWSVKTIVRIVSSLEEKNIISTYHKKSLNRVTYYKINYDVLNSIIEKSIGSKSPKECSQIDPMLINRDYTDTNDCDSEKTESRAEEIEFVPFDEDDEEKWNEIIKKEAPPRKKVKEHKPPAEKKPKIPSDPTYWDFLSMNKDLGIAFYRSSKLTPVKSEFGKWVKGFQELAEAGITAEDIPRIIEEMRKQRLTIKAPQSILAIGRDLKAKKEANNELEGWTLR